MEFLIYVGTALALGGLAGLGYCIRKAMALKRQAKDGADVKKQLQGLVAINMAALGGAAIGLAMIVTGIVLTRL